LDGSDYRSARARIRGEVGAVVADAQTVMALSEDLSHKSIARGLDISRHTGKLHAKSIPRKLGAKTRADRRCNRPALRVHAFATPPIRPSGRIRRQEL